MSRAMAVFAVFMSLIISAALIASVPIKVYSQLPFVPSSPSFPSESTDNNNVSSGATASNNQSLTTNTNAPEQQQQIEQIEGFSTYQDPTFGFTIQYPSNWTVVTSDVTPSMVENNTENPALAIFNTVSFNPSNSTISSIRIAPLSLVQHLDPTDMKIKNKTAHDSATYIINYMNSGESSKPTLFQTIFKPVKDIATSVGKNHYPAWRVDYTTTAFGNTGYSIAIFAVSGDKVFKFVLDANDPLQIPTYLHIFQNMVDSFQIH